MSDTARRALRGTGVALAVMAALSGGMLPLRTHLSVATTALVLVVPVVAGVVVGGFAAGVFAVACGFLVYDVLFIPPYGTLTVGQTQNWVALGVYAAVMLLVAQVVAKLDAARTVARRHEEHARRLYELTDLLVRSGRHGTALLERIAQAVRDTFGLDAVILLLERDGGLVPVAGAGERWNAEELAELLPPGGVPVRTPPTGPSGTRMLPLAATGEPVGVLGLRGRPLSDDDQALLRTFANQIAMTVERGRLEEQAARAELLEHTERLQQALVGAVSHDLQTPLATIKVAASTLRDPDVDIDEEVQAELLTAIDAQADRLSRLVTNLLDMSRVQAGALRVTRLPVSVPDLVRGTLDPLAPLVGSVRLCVDIPPELPLVDVDHALIGQVLANLVENAARYAPADTEVEISARARPDGPVEICVADRGPGIPADQRAGVFELFHRVGPGQGTGVGLTIAKAFVEAHGEHIWVEERRGGGAMFCFTVPVAAVPEDPA